MVVSTTDIMAHYDAGDKKEESYRFAIIRLYGLGARL
jgi:hypothetical protein